MAFFLVTLIIIANYDTMKKNYILWVTFIVTTITFGQTIFINEIHYDNLGAVIQF